MGKLLTFLLILLGIYLLRRALFRPPAAPRGGEAPRSSAPAVERMVECAQCGLHVPESEAVMGTLADEGLTFCCEAHRQAYRTRG